MARYRTFDTVRRSLEHGRELVHSRRTGQTELLSPEEAQWLFSCQGFKGLSEHAIHHLRQARRQRLKGLGETVPGGRFVRWVAKLLDWVGGEPPAGDRGVARVEKRLREFADAGFLVSTSELQAAIRQAAEQRGDDSPPSIQSLGIPTKNRPALLHRALTSHAEELERHGRAIEIIVLDDSENDGVRTENRSVIDRVNQQYGVELRYADRERRAAYAQRVAEVSRTDPKIAHFALVGDPEYETHGGPRNAHLLDAVGRLCLQVDDDVLGGTRTVPGRKSGLALGPRGGDVHQFWYFQSEEAAFDFSEGTDTDLLSAHEELLGRSVADAAVEAVDRGEKLSLEHMNASLLRDIEDGARVAVSLAGTTGDSAMPNHIDARLLQKGASFRRIVGSGEEEYNANLTTRYLARSPRQRKVVDGGFLMSTIIGFDCRHTVPPFMVPGRNMDGTFGAVVHNVLRTFRVGYVPYVFRHAPPTTRRRAAPENVTGPSKLRLNDLFITAIKAYSNASLTPDPEEGLRNIGRYLEALSSMDQPDFNAFIRDRVVKKIAGRIRFAERRLTAENETPEYWARHLRALVRNYGEHLTKELFFAPIDLEGEPDRRMVTTKQLFNKYGRLLKQWPAMMDGARTLRADGCRVSEPV